MDAILQSEHLMLFVGAAILAGVLIGVVLPNTLPTARGELNRRRREYRHCVYKMKRAEKAAQRAGQASERLSRNARNVEPRKLDEAKAYAADMATMLDHARDEVMVAENHVRRIILERFPPARQEKLLARFVSGEPGSKMPFSF